MSNLFKDVNDPTIKIYTESINTRGNVQIDGDLNVDGNTTIAGIILPDTIQSDRLEAKNTTTVDVEDIIFEAGTMDLKAGNMKDDHVTGGIPLGEAGQTVLDPGFTNVSIVGALNELKSGAVGASFLDSTFDIKNNVDNSKVCMLDCSNITTGTTRTLTIPDIDNTIVTKSAVGNGTIDTVDAVDFNGSSIDGSDASFIKIFPGTKTLHLEPNSGGHAQFFMDRTNTNGIAGIRLRTGLGTDYELGTFGFSSDLRLYNDNAGANTFTVGDTSNIMNFTVLPTCSASVTSGTQLTNKTYVDSGTSTLTNKTLTDNTTFYQDDVDNSKKAQLQLSGITTANTRTYTCPDNDGILVTKDTSGTNGLLGPIDRLQLTDGNDTQKIILNSVSGDEADIGYQGGNLRIRLQNTAEKIDFRFGGLDGEGGESRFRITDLGADVQIDNPSGGIQIESNTIIRASNIEDVNRLYFQDEDNVGKVRWKGTTDWQTGIRSGDHLSYRIPVTGDYEWREVTTNIMQLDSTDGLQIDKIGELTSNNGIDFHAGATGEFDFNFGGNSGLIISEPVANTDVKIHGQFNRLAYDSGVDHQFSVASSVVAEINATSLTITGSDQLKTNTINETTGGSGVTIQGTNIDDDTITPSGGTLTLQPNGGFVDIGANVADGNSTLYVTRTGATDIGGIYYRTGATVGWNCSMPGTANYDIYGHVAAGVALRCQSTDNAIFLPAVYSDDIGAGNRDLEIKSDGQLGYNASILASKTNIQNIDSDFIYNLQPKQFNYRKSTGDHIYSQTEYYNEQSYGLIAEEVELINPELCSYDYVHPNTCTCETNCGHPDNCDCNCTIEQCTKILRTVHYKKLIPCLLDKVKQQHNRITSLENVDISHLQQITDLTTRCQTAEDRVLAAEGRCTALEARMLAVETALGA